MQDLTYTWDWWAHRLYDTDWSPTSYTKIHTISTVEECVALMDTMFGREELLKNYMICLMKTPILPFWEDTPNRDGGSFTIRIASKGFTEARNTILYKIVGNTISTNPIFLDDLAGITISFKKHVYIVKIWMKTCIHTATELCKQIRILTRDEIGFKKHSLEV